MKTLKKAHLRAEALPSPCYCILDKKQREMHNTSYNINTEIEWKVARTVVW